jgi:MFS family permease
MEGTMSGDGQTVVSAGDASQFDPLELISFLRSSDFRLGASEVLRITQLLQYLTDNGRAPRTPDEAARWLAPILCTTPRQQTMLPDRLRAFAAEQVRRALPRPSPAEERIIAPPPPLPRSWRRAIAVIVALALIGFLLIVGLPHLKSGVTTSPGTTSTPTTSNVLQPWIPQGTLAGALNILPAAAVPPLIWLFIVRWRRRKVPVLSRRPYEGLAQATLRPSGTSLEPFGGEGLSQALQGMRAHRRIPSLKPDATASARATAAASGHLVLVPGWRPRLPEYPIVVEALSTRDHVVALARAFSVRLEEEGVEHALYLFGSNLQRLRTLDDKPVTLADLAARYREDVLLILGDGDALYDRIFGCLRPAMADMEAWRLVILLTPVPRWRWSWRERRLAEAGLIVLPATPEGIRLLGDFLRTEGRPPRPAFERMPRRPGPLALEGPDSIRWHSDRIPGEAEREAVLDAIALELRPGGFELMCVLALFPELRPDLTLHAAQSLKGPRGEPLVDEVGFAALAALPWFRLGRIPDWLRLELVRSLSPERKEEAHRMFAAWLTATNGTGAGVEITAETLSRAVTEDAIRNPVSALRDVIFLRFCNREDLSAIDLEVPDAVSRAVGVQALRSQHMTLVVALALSTVLLVLGFFFGSSFRAPSETSEPFVFGLTGLQLVGLAGGIWHALRGYPDSSGQYGFLPLVVTIIGLPLSAFTLLISTNPPNDTFFILLLSVPCLAMAIAPVHRFIPFPIPTVWFQRAMSDLPALVLVGVGLVGLPLFFNSVFIFLALLAYPIGVAGLYARHFAVGTPSLISHSVVASLSSLFLPIAVIRVIPRSVFQDWFLILALVLPHLGCALALNTARGMKLAPPLAMCGATVLLAAGAVTLFDSPLPGYLALQFAAALVPLAIAHSQYLRRAEPWIAAAVGSTLGSGIAFSAADLLGLPSPVIPRFSFLSLGLLTLPATIGWINARLESAPYSAAFRAAIAAYRPNFSSLILVLLWLIGLRVTLGDFSLNLSPLYLPASAWIAMRYGTAGLMLFIWSAAPLLIGFDFGIVGTRVDPGLFAACILVHRLVAEPQFRARLPSLQRLHLPGLIALILIGGAELVVTVPGNIEFGGSLGFFLGAIMVLLGVAGAPRLSVIGALAVAGLITIATALFGSTVQPPDWLDANYRVNPISLYLLYEVGRLWIVSFSSSQKPSPSLRELLQSSGKGIVATLRMTIPSARNRAAYNAYWRKASTLPLQMNLALVALWAIYVGQRWFDWFDSAPGLLPIFIYFAVGGRAVFNWRITAVLSISIMSALGLASLVHAPSMLMGSLPRQFSLLGFLSDLCLFTWTALGATWLGWRLGRWTVAAGNDWLRQYGFQTLSWVPAPRLAPEPQAPEIVKTDIPARLDRLPWGRFHTLVVVALGITWILNGLEVTLAANVTQALMNSLGLSITQVALSHTAYVTGLVIGALFFGWATDRLGRKRLFFTTLLVYLMFTTLTGLCWNIESLALFRFLAGTGIGGEYAAINSAIQELIPARFRGRTDLLISGTFWIGAAIGALVLTVLLNPTIINPELGWRFAFLIGAPLALIVLFIRRRIPESPRWLMTHGRVNEAEAIVSSIEEKFNQLDQLDSVERLPRVHLIGRRFTPLREVVQTIFHVYPGRALVSFSLMSAQALMYNAAIFNFAVILDQFFKIPLTNLSLYFLPIAAGNFFGPLVLGRLFDTFGRKQMIALTYAISGLAIAVSGYLLMSGALSALTQSLAWMATFFFASAAASAAYLTAGEIFPLEIRALAIAFFFAVGTGIGAVSLWLLATLIGQGPESLYWGFIVGSAAMVAAAVIELIWGVAAERRPLEDVARPLTFIE